jgi:2-keto-3-deoxy-L-rhamnonate aldolase RhmA
MDRNQYRTLQSLIEEREVLLGCNIDGASPALAELAGMLGYDIVWADLEHLSIDWAQAENFCRGACAGGALPLLRVPNAEREHILHALEAGARLVVVPMVESPDTAQAVVRHGKYAALGMRGFNGSSRGLHYGIGDKLATMAWANEQTHLFVQIETVEAVRRCAEILAVPGISGGLVGPGDLSISMGKPLAFDDPEMIAMFRDAIRMIRESGKIAAAVAPHPALLQAGLNEGLQIVICASETIGLRTYWAQILRDVNAMLQSAGCRREGVSAGIK